MFKQLIILSGIITLAGCTTYNITSSEDSIVTILEGSATTQKGLANAGKADKQLVGKGAKLDDKDTIMPSLSAPIGL